jgi:prevent-host-death family protein
MRTMTSREANQDFSRAKREAKSGPVIITERGRPTNVLMSYAELQDLTRGHSLNVDLEIANVAPRAMFPTSTGN